MNLTIDHLKLEISRHCKNYEEAKLHSAHIDTLLGLDTQSIEDLLQKTATLQPGRQHWIGLPTQSLLTPYSEFLEILQKFESSSIIDLGAGYGRLGIVTGLFYPRIRFTGYEIIPERVKAGQDVFRKLGLDPHSLQVQDLACPNFLLPDAESYFIYDFGERAAVEKSLEEIKSHAKTHSVTVVARGRGSRSWIEQGHPWLAGVRRARHFGGYSIYRSS